MLESLYNVKVFVILDVIIPKTIPSLVFPSEEPYKIIKVGQWDISYGKPLGF